MGDASRKPAIRLNIAECEFLGDRYTFLDCPGSVEYLFESEAVLSPASTSRWWWRRRTKKIAQLSLRLLEDRGIPHGVLFLNKARQDRGAASRDVSS